MKLGGWVVMLLTLVMFLTLIGVNTPLGDMLGTFGVSISPVNSEISADIENSSFWDFIFNNSTGILALAGLGGAIIIGLFAKGYDPSLVYAGFIVWIAGIMIPTFFSVIKLVGKYNQWWMTSLTSIVFIALGTGFVFSCIDYFGGR